VSRVVRLSPHFTRVTFAGDELAEFGTAGLDQRVKVILPIAGRGFVDFPDGEDWYRAWRELPAERRNTFRTYTVRAVRPAEREVDIDFALHGDLGPASAWASAATAGEEILLVGPDELSPGRTLGIDFRPGTVDTVLLAGDETAAPAICAILEELEADVTGHAFIEVPSREDALSVAHRSGVRVAWLAREDRELGAPLTEAVMEWGRARAVRHGASPEDVADDVLLWEVPDDVRGDEYAWLAGEAGVITGLRRHLVRDLGIDRKTVAFMGYWRAGRAEGS